MLFVNLAIDRVMAKEKEQEEVSKCAMKRGCDRRLAKDRQAASASLVTDSEWLGLGAEEQLAWAKNSQDPRVAVGSHSPLEKKIESLGGVRSSEVRKLLAQKFQQENETIHQLQAMSFDFRFAKAEEYYYQRYQEMMTEEAWKYKVVPKWEFKVEEKRSQSAKTEDAKKWDYLVSERELNHIEKHICRVERARGLRDHNYRLLPQRIPREILCPKILTLEKDEKNENIQKTPKTETRRHKVAWAKEQMKGHQDRMIRGRELTEQRNDQREAQKLSSYVPPFLKSQARKAEAKEFEWVTAYPIFQPYQKALLEVTILMEKSKKEDTIKKPLKRELLSMPPFLRSQLEKNKV
ncbi:putative uncharacterized protein ZNRD1-AS1 [Microcebus murinus]|uniref:putative uncharacterized protein ZNRD1-AS1 n=1 Tax=Microcebus murinus TaxID=30608 RepID=UPI0006431990|nr:putative uncharacterized protein ZNRD1-AS1 isoform X2 [Microcebus murinus]